VKLELKFGLGLMALILLACAVAFPPPSEMTDGHVGLLMLALVVVAIMLGFPAAFTLMGMGVLFALYAFNGNTGMTLNLVVQRAYAIMTNDVLIAIPLFVFMGYLVERANLIGRLFRALHVALAWLPGALAVATLATCAVFATATGIIGAVVTVMGLLAMPAMLRAGYRPSLTAGTIAAGGCLGILIPPSILLIVYGATAGVSVVQLYAGALFPGLMLAGLYVVYVMILAKLRPELAPPLPRAERELPLPAYAAAHAGLPQQALPALLRAIKGRRNAHVPMRTLAANLAVAVLPLLGYAVLALGAYRGVAVSGVEGAALAAAGGDHPLADPAARGGAPTSYWAAVVAGAVALAGFYAWLTVRRLELMKMLLASFFPLATLILAVLGTIIFGLATPTEAAGVGALGGFLLAAAYRQLNLTMFKESLYLTAKTSAMVCWLFIGSSVFSAAFALLGGQELIERWVLSLDLTPLQFMVLAQLIIFLLGWPLDWAEIIVIFVPIFLPLLDHFGINPLFFGLLVALNLQTSYLSPPVAMAAFYLRAIAPPSVTLRQIFAGMMPFIGLQLIAIVLLYLFPQIGLWLPARLYG
jgi:TRAP-type mannitol/chloroaromatic compound transport system permease large subunit